jgi:hypothetical protein
LEWTDEELPAIHRSYAPSPDRIARVLGYTPMARVRT